MIDLSGFSVADISRAATGGLIAAAWQGVLLSLIAACVLRLLPKTPAAVRFAIWFGVFAVVALLPIAGLFHHASPASAQAPWLTIDPRWCLVVAGAWAMASLMRAASLLLAVLRVRALSKRATPPKDFAVNEHSIGQTKPVRSAQLCVSDEVDRPTVIGFFSPKILIPVWLLAKLTPAELEQVVLHESGHLGRADDWMNLLQKIALVLFPLNPALAWVERRLCFERELACDEHVLEVTGAPKAYAACLASLAEHRLGHRGLALALGALGRESELGRRVGRILRGSKLMRPIHARLVLGGAMVALLTAAVGFERCPEVVRFASASEMNPIASAGIGETQGNKYSFQQVVFRVPSVPVQILVKPESLSHRAASVPRPAQRRESRVDNLAAARLDTAQGARQFRAMNVADQTGSSEFDQAGGDTMVQLVVVTSWQREDGARVVLTSAQTDAQGRIIGSQSVSRPAPPSDQIHPYAAVPVRDGWLFFQL